jgi:hypothetical protein
MLLPKPEPKPKELPKFREQKPQGNKWQSLERKELSQKFALRASGSVLNFMKACSRWQNA